MDSASPRFRQDLTVSTTEADGVSCVDVSDAKTGANFRFYDFEYQLALQLNGQPLAQVIAWAAQTYGVELKDEGIAEFSGRLSELGFLETGATATEPAPEGDSAADEWMSPQGTKTAQFVPDPAMLAGAPGPSLDRTPVASLDMLPDMQDEAQAAAQSTTTHTTQDSTKSAPTPAPPIPAAPPVAVAPTPRAAAPAAPTAPANASESAKSRWAVDLDGALQAPDSPAAVIESAPPAIKPDVKLPPRPVAAPAPAGVAERRQPPPPDSVVMAGFSEDANRGGAHRSSGPRISVLILILVLGIGAALAGYFYMNRRPAPAPQALRVRVMSPEPSAVYRWFSGRGAVTDYETSTVAFAGPGRLTDLLPAGTELDAGDIIGKLQGATAIETLLAHDRSRVGFYRQLRDSMRAAGNQPELRLAELRLAEKEHLVAESRANLAGFTVAATEPGEVVETLAKIGAPVLPGVPVARVKGKLLHGAFELDADDQAALARLDFCRVEVIGLGPRAENTPPPGAPAVQALADSSPAAAQAGPRFVDCQSPTHVSPGRTKVEVALPGDLGLVSGQPLRLARRRYDAVFPVPAAALVGAEQKSIWIAGRDGRAEARAVSVADLGDEALVNGGLQVGDRVIVDPPAGLQAGAPIVEAP
jgi:hypothetical protein